MYPDKITGSMQRAIEETNRRRDKQITFNAEHGIEPVTINKPVADIMASAYTNPGQKSSRRAQPSRQVAERSPAYGKVTDLRQAVQSIAKLELAMYTAAENLEFEPAAEIRDQIQQLKQQGLGASG